MPIIHVIGDEMRYVIGGVILVIILLVILRLSGVISGNPSGYSPGYTVTTSSSEMAGGSSQGYPTPQGGYAQPNQNKYSQPSSGSYQRPVAKQPSYQGYYQQPSGYPTYQPAPAIYNNNPCQYYCAPVPYPVTTNTYISPANNNGFCHDACSCNYCSPDLIQRQMYSYW